jgi:hypothetical protein
MWRALGLLAAGVVLLGPGNPTAGAAPTTRCPFLPDAAGDAVDPEGRPGSDLLSVDIASDRSQVTVSVSYGGEDALQAPGKGHLYSTEVATGEAVFRIEMGVASDATWFELYQRGVSGDGGSATAATYHRVASIEGTVDRAHHRATAWFPVSLTGGQLSYGRRVTLYAITFPGVGVMNVPPAPVEPPGGHAFGIWGVSTDDTHKSSPYRIGGRGCVDVHHG